jgi:maltooligosyltrehalose synthase
MLDALPSATPDELMRTWPDGRIKLFLTQRVLRFRHEHADLFQRGEYLPIQVSGTFAECCVSFVRSLGDKWIIVISPRLSSRVGCPPIGQLWKDTVVELPETLSLEHAHDLFTCRPMSLKDRQAKIADAFSVLPFGVITNL